MSTDFQQGRIALGTRLRELRTEAHLTVRALAARCEWPPSKVSKLENGKQTATGRDLEKWAQHTGNPDVEAELKGKLRGLESTYRSWRRQLSGGHRVVQDTIGEQHRRTRLFQGYTGSVVPGILQTAEYARAVLSRYAELHGVSRDIEGGVRSRMRRQEGLYTPGNRYRVVIAEAALMTMICTPSVLRAQLDRLMSVLGLDTVELGVIPLTAPLKIAPGDNFWIHDRLLVIAETWHTEMWLDSPEDIALYSKVWESMHECAAYGPAAHRLLSRARASIDLL